MGGAQGGAAAGGGMGGHHNDPRPSLAEQKFNDVGPLSDVARNAGTGLMNAGKAGVSAGKGMKADNDDNPRPKNLAQSEKSDANSPGVSAALDAGNGLGKAGSSIGKGIKNSMGGPKK